MKKFLALLLVCVVALAVVSCDKNTPVPTPVVEPADFADFNSAINQTPAARVTVETTMTSDLGILKSIIKTVFNPDGSATVDYYIEKFNPDFDDARDIIPYAKVITLNPDGSYSDGGEFAGLLDGVASVNINLDSTKFASYNVENGTLSASVKAENTAAVFGAAINADVNFLLTISNNRVISVVLNYTTELGAFQSVIYYS